MIFFLSQADNKTRMWQIADKRTSHADSGFKVSLACTSHQKSHIITNMVRKKSLTKKQYQKDLIKYVVQILACTFLLGIIFVAIFKEVF